MLGLRLSEVASLDLTDFNVDSYLIKINGKGQKQRLVPLTHSILEAFEDYKKQYRETFNKELQGHAIRTIDDENASKNTISLMFRRLRDKVNFKIYPHLLRHTFATFFLLNRW